MVTEKVFFFSQDHHRSSLLLLQNCYLQLAVRIVNVSHHRTQNRSRIKTFNLKTENLRFQT